MLTKLVLDNVFSLDFRSTAFCRSWTFLSFNNLDNTPIFLWVQSYQSFSLYIIVISNNLWVLKTQFSFQSSFLAMRLLAVGVFRSSFSQSYLGNISKFKTIDVQRYIDNRHRSKSIFLKVQYHTVHTVFSIPFLVRRNVHGTRDWERNNPHYLWNQYSLSYRGLAGLSKTSNAYKYYKVSVKQYKRYSYKITWVSRSHAWINCKI